MVFNLPFKQWVGPPTLGASRALMVMGIVGILDCGIARSLHHSGGVPFPGD